MPGDRGLAGDAGLRRRARPRRSPSPASWSLVGRLPADPRLPAQRDPQGRGRARPGLPDAAHLGLRRPALGLRPGGRRTQGRAPAPRDRLPRGGGRPRVPRLDRRPGPARPRGAARRRRRRSTPQGCGRTAPTSLLQSVLGAVSRQRTAERWTNAVRLCAKVGRGRRHRPGRARSSGRCCARRPAPGRRGRTRRDHGLRARARAGRAAARSRRDRRAARPRQARGGQALADQRVADELRAGRRTARADQPYLAHALYALVPVAAPEVAATDLRRALAGLRQPRLAGRRPTCPTVAGELAHVTWHLLLDHADRARDQHVDATDQQGRGREAADATVAHTLAADRLCPSDLPVGRRPGPARGPLGRGVLRDHLPAAGQPRPDGPADAAAAARCRLRQRLRRRTPRARAAARRRRRARSLPEDARDIRRRVAIEYRRAPATARPRRHAPATPGAGRSRSSSPRSRWEPLLAGAVRRAAGWANGRTDYTYARPSRRQSSDAADRAARRCDGRCPGSRWSWTPPGASTTCCSAARSARWTARSGRWGVRLGTSAVYQLRRGRPPGPAGAPRAGRPARPAVAAPTCGSGIRAAHDAAAPARPRRGVHRRRHPVAGDPTARQRGDRRAAGPGPVAPAADAVLGDPGGVPRLVAATGQHSSPSSGTVPSTR